MRVEVLYGVSYPAGCGVGARTTPAGAYVICPYPTAWRPRMPNPLLVLTAQREFDPSDPSSRAHAHAWINTLFDAGGSSTPIQVFKEELASAGTESAAQPKYVQLGSGDVENVLTQMASGAMGRVLNDGERLMLTETADSAPESAPYTHLCLVLGGKEKFGNLSLSLSRRLKVRGWQEPYAADETNTGYVMTQDISDVVKEVLTGNND